MVNPKSAILKILKIGHDTSMRGEGISMNNALKGLEYKLIRQNINAENLIPFIEENPLIIEEWIMFSEDKRTDGGFSLDREQMEKLSLKKQAKLSATFIIKELDFWSQYQ